MIPASRCGSETIAVPSPADEPHLCSAIARHPLSARGGRVTRGLLDRLPEPVADRLRAWRADARDRRDWSSYRRRPVVPPPHIVKVRAVLDHARRFGTGVLIETGTLEGEMIRKVHAAFRRAYTIELDPALARRAARRLARFPGVEVIEGDSTRRLPEVLARVGEPALFWLDGHYSGGVTARGSKDTPLVEELDAIARHGVRGHVVLVDDARCLGAGDYPSLERLTRCAFAVPGIANVEVADDIVRCTPAAGS
jgi:hypothetical protein